MRKKNRPVKIKNINVYPRTGTFMCRVCKVVAMHTKTNVGDMMILRSYRASANDHLLTDNIDITFCDSCNEYSLWIDDRLVHPDISTAPEPNECIPSNVKETYEEARAIFEKSPRAAAAILRLALEQLCVCINQEKGGLNEQIKFLVKNGASTRIQRALDVVRLTGNNAVHPGEIDWEVKHPQEQVTVLFKFINWVAMEMIESESIINEMYEDFPEDKKRAIKKRDKK